MKLLALDFFLVNLDRLLTLPPHPGCPFFSFFFFFGLTTMHSCTHSCALAHSRPCSLSAWLVTSGLITYTFGECRPEQGGEGRIPVDKVVVLLLRCVGVGCKHLAKSNMDVFAFNKIDTPPPICFLFLSPSRSPAILLHTDLPSL